MKMNLRTLVLASAVMTAAVLTSIPAMAAITGATILHVPFAFTADGKTLSAGDYTVKRDGDIVRLQSADASQNFAWVTLVAPGNGGRVVLRFSNDGRMHALESVQFDAVATPPLTRHTRKAEDISPENVVGR